MTREEFRTIMEMVRMIIDGSKDKEDALEKIDSLTILKGTDKEKDKNEQKFKDGLATVFFYLKMLL